MKLILRLGNIRNIFCLSLLLAFMFVTAVDSYAAFTRPQIPKLSLMGEEEDYDTDFYPDGRVWVPPTITGAREFLVPVFITNNWFDYKNAQGIALYRVPPITSFEFSVFYNEKAIRAIGVETVNPSYIDDIDPLAKGFHIKTDDAKDDYYWYFINPNKWNDTKDNLDGRRLTITGVSSQPLPTTDAEVITYEVLCYIRFRVVAKREDGNSGFNLIQTTPIYIDNRKVMFNSMNTASDYAWQHMLDYDTTNYLNLYNRGKIGNNRGRADGELFMPETYLDGLNNAPISEDDNNAILPGPMTDDAMFKTEPVYPGVITLKITDNVPKFRVASITDDEFPSNENKSEYTIDDLVTVDDNSPEQYAIARIKVTNSTSKSRLQNVTIETDSEWLRVVKDQLNENSTLTIKNNGRDAFIKWIDNGILGEQLNPILKPTLDDGDVLLEVRCDPTRLPKTAGEPHGIHVGYITLKSDYAEVSPVKIKVTFIFLKNPYEPDWTKAPQNPGGINIYLNNRINQQLRLVFGTGTRATDGVDNLYGEFAYGSPMATNRFDARWYPVDKEIEQQVPFGFGDFAPNIITPRTLSRDIRAYDLPSGVNSYKYWCKFNNLNQDYPITVEWDIRDFPVGAQLFIRTVINGEAGQAINMREATAVNENRRSITITDTRVNEFFIEYTLPKSLNFVDDDGNPIIKRGWNLLSLPLKPDNTKWNVVYPNAINIPWAFVNSQYQQREVLRFGEGYFVKYPNTVDTKFAGALINKITKEFNPILVFAGDTPDPEEPSYKGGWCLVGALSVPTSVEGIEFEASEGGTLPDKGYTKKYGVYGYKTDLGYYPVSNLVPGMGYWIKVSNDGYYNLFVSPNPKNEVKSYEVEKASALDNSQAIIVRDNAQRESRLYMTSLNNVDVKYYEYPPVPMGGLYDVRFADNKYLTNENSNVIKLQGVNYPIAINVNNADADYTFIDPVNGTIYGTVKAGTVGSVEIKELPYNAVKVMKTEVMDVAGFSFSAYPNPTKDFTTVNFNVTDNSNVTVELYDALGNKVSTLINGSFNKGEYSQQFDLSGYAAGNYIAKITAGNNTSVVKINVVK